MLILGVILIVWCGLLMMYWCTVTVRVTAIASNPPTVREGLRLSAPAGGWPKLSIIVPVHNEQRVIDACAASLRAQEYPHIEFILVLDRCTDRTRQLLEAHAADSRLIIVENDLCPADWAGKCHAAHLGAERASGQWLLFTDADTQFDTELSRAAMAMALHSSTPMLSLLSSLTYTTGYERIAQPVATIALMRLFPLTRSGSKKRPRPFANGQFMLFDRTWYDKIGGHRSVKDDLLEDLAFARLIHEAGGQTTILLADGLLKCSMYDSLAAFQRGWKRIFIEACRRRIWRLRKHAWRLCVLGIVAPLTQIGALGLAWAISTPLLAALLTAVVLSGWLAQAAALMLIYKLSGAPRRFVFAYPLGCWIVSRIMRDGAKDLQGRHPVTWGGREYVLEPR